MKNKKTLILLFLLSSFLFLKKIHAQNKVSIGNISNLVGRVEIIRDEKKIKAEKEFPIYETDQIITYENSAVKVNFKDGSNFMGFQNTKVKISEYKTKEKKSGGINLKSLVDIAQGSVRFFVKPKEDGTNDTKFITPNSVMLIRGTQGYIKVNPDAFSVVSGSVQVALIKAPTHLVTCVQGYTVSGADLTVTKTPDSELKRNDAQVNIFGINSIENDSDLKPKDNEKEPSQEKGGETSPQEINQGNTGNVPDKGPVVIHTDGSSTQALGLTTPGENNNLPFVTVPTVNPGAISSATTVNNVQTEISRVFAPTAPIPTATAAAGQGQPPPKKLIINLNPEN